MKFKQNLLKLTFSYFTFDAAAINDKLVWIQNGKMFVYDLKQDNLQIVKHNDVEYWLTKPLPLITFVNKLEQMLQIEIERFNNLKFQSQTLTKIEFKLAQPTKIYPAKGYILSAYEFLDDIRLLIDIRCKRQYVILSDYIHGSNFAIFEFNYFVPRIARQFNVDDKLKYRIASIIDSNFYRRILPVVEYKTQFEGKNLAIQFFLSSANLTALEAARIII